MDTKEQRRKRDRERYAEMTDEEKQEIKKRNSERRAQMTVEENLERLKKRREAYKQNKKCANREPELTTNKNAQKRQKYANMEPKQKKARIEQITTNKVLKQSTPCKESIAMVNPAYIATDKEDGTSTFNARQRRPVTPGERQTLLHRRNEEFSVRQRKIKSVSSQEDTFTKQPEVLINGNNLKVTIPRYSKNSIQYVQLTNNYGQASTIHCVHQQTHSTMPMNMLRISIS
jgi:hypothetical protein